MAILLLLRLSLNMEIFVGLAFLLSLVAVGAITLATNYPANTYLFKVNKRNTGNRYEICSKLTLKTPE